MNELAYCVYCTDRQSAMAVVETLQFLELLMCALLLLMPLTYLMTRLW
jgi:hypothetical protein